ncbi:hypothetical protein ACFL2Z_05475 [Candidatus Eisenbacteria bacterium]|uniref:Cohesin domain-containing protein n=1 Tax=Eiseniibacteriota bacterium TaxID=2212470 RepID=A0ABV6YQI0_UNCEI
MKLRSILGLAFWLALSTALNAQPTIFFQPDDAVISGGLCNTPLFCMEVHVDAIPNMAGYDIGIIFKPEHLNFLDAREGDIFALAGHPAVFFWSLRTGTTLDTVFVNAADLGGSVSGSGHLFSLCFEPPWLDEAVGSPLVFVRSLVRDSANADVPVVTSDGAISVYCPTAIGISRWGTIKSFWR